MIISNSRRFIFCHIHKTAGESITQALASDAAWNDIVLGTTALGARMNEPYSAAYGLDKHSSARMIRAVVGDEIWRSYYTFSFVRHPFDRAMSLYRYLAMVCVEHRRGGLRPYLRFLRKDPARAPWSWPGMQAYLASGSFSEFIRHPLFMQGIGAQPQMHFLRGADGPGIDVDFVGRFETLGRDFRVVAESVGLPHAVLPHRNPSRGAATRDLPTADRAHLAAIYREDLEAFGFDPDGSARAAE